MAATNLHFLQNPFPRPIFSPRRIVMRAPRMVFKCCSSNSSSTSLGEDIFSLTSSSTCDVDYLGQSTKGDLNLNLQHLETFGLDGQSSLEGPIEQIARLEEEEAGGLLRDLGILSPSAARLSPRGIFCSRTLNLRSISAIGYDMDYTLIHYNVKAWEGRAYDYCMENLKNMGFPLLLTLIWGIVIDKHKGNLVKADRFGYVKRAMHGTKMLSTQAVSEIYGRELVDLRKESQWEFLNTLFSVSEAVAFMQMVDRLDDGTIPADLGPLDYKGLYKAVGKALFRAHVEGQLKSEIMSKPELFVEPDPELPLALLDQKEAGKKLLLITNSDYQYTDKMMQHSFNRFLPNDMGWRDLFDMVIVSARKPEFFQMSHPLYEVVTGEGLMRPCFKACTGDLSAPYVLILFIPYDGRGLYSGGSALMVENSLNIHGDEILYVGDHIYTDVSQSKVHLRWRTALVCRELEEEYNALIQSRSHRGTVIELINQKEVLGDLFNQLRLALQRRSKGRPAQTLAATNMDDRKLTESMQKLLIVMQRLDEKIAPLLEADGELFNKRWGFLSRAGLSDKSHLMRQIEKYADIYTSRVSNFLIYTPFMYFRSQEQTLAHDSYLHYCPEQDGILTNSDQDKQTKKLENTFVEENITLQEGKQSSTYFHGRFEPSYPPAGASGDVRDCSVPILVKEPPDSSEKSRCMKQRWPRKRLHDFQIVSFDLQFVGLTGHGNLQTIEDCPELGLGGRTTADVPRISSNPGSVLISDSTTGGCF
ncbi:HAD-superfamily hydrolase isoform 3 [Hibiscus syriacus]|uniref:HAD-superfamily hydrolase isoform 3 n=1 Tax=Hibiscus syriacus TaxID=106335 RepID=A0A6A3D4C3_HIBSY|nr:HAD-superfamily hydrolase isoform 3 [Hibiscus syriacus]